LFGIFAEFALDATLALRVVRRFVVCRVVRFVALVLAVVCRCGVIGRAWGYQRGVERSLAVSEQAHRPQAKPQNGVLSVFWMNAARFGVEGSKDRHATFLFHHGSLVSRKVSLIITPEA
jgi:hypothetical protein